MPVRVVVVEGFAVEIEEAEIHRDSIAGGGRSGLDDVERGGLSSLAESVGGARETISAVLRYVKTSIDAVDQPDELTVEFGIKLGGESGIPYVTKGTTEASLAIKACWKGAPPK